MRLHSSQFCRFFYYYLLFLGVISFFFYYQSGQIAFHIADISNTQDAFHM